jgi:hypothetical protein
MASGERPDYPVTRARRIELVAPAGVRLHLDDKNWPSAEALDEATSLTVSCLAGAATFVASA